VSSFLGGGCLITWFLGFLAASLRVSGLPFCILVLHVSVFMCSIVFLFFLFGLLLALVQQSLSSQTVEILEAYRIGDLASDSGEWTRGGKVLWKRSRAISSSPCARNRWRMGAAEKSRSCSAVLDLHYKRHLGT
jgi:hypothetical protein